MSEHRHDWNPREGECGQYACGCGATGYRSALGLIVPHKKSRPARNGWTAKNKHGDSIGIGNTWVTRKPGAE